MSMAQMPFGIVPVEVAMDSRLTLQQMRVLIALYTFRNRNTEMACPTREEIRERTGMALPKISAATSDLERLGWLTKVGNGGRSRATRYRVHVPELIPETVTDPVLNGYRIGYETLPDSGRGIEQTIHTEQTNINNAHAPAAPSSKPAPVAKPDGVCQQVWADFLAVRKSKRAALTATALAGIEREAAKAGIGLQQALALCCEAGWASFKAEWAGNRSAALAGRNGAAAVDAQAPVETYAQRAARQRMEEVAPMAARKAPGQRSSFDMAQAFMRGDVVDVTPAQQRIAG